MQTTSRIRALLISALAASILPGCVVGRSTDVNTLIQAPMTAGDGKVAMAVIASDFVNAMRQIPSLEPALATVQLLRTQMDDGLILAFKNTLEQAGYAVRWVSEPTAANLLQYRREQTTSMGKPDTVLLDIALGEVELRRTYAGLSNDTIQPLTPMYVRGADAIHVVLDDAEFFGSESLKSSDSLPLTVPNSINPLAGLVAKAGGDNSLLAGATSRLNAVNVFDLGGSNYASLLSEHDVVMEQTLTFPNDSLRLGGDNKQLIDALVKRFNPRTDVFSVIGCSLGPTKLKSGNAALALGRASRVREALLFAGIDQQKILDEGCWAGDSSSNTLPRRGVVLTLNRQTS